MRVFPREWRPNHSSVDKHINNVGEKYLVSKWSKFIYLTHYNLFFSTQSSFTLQLHIFLNCNVYCFILLMKKKVSGWCLIHVGTAASASASSKKCRLFNTSVGFREQPEVGRCGCGTAVNFRFPSFVHCNALLHRLDVEENCSFQAWFCRCVTWVIVRCHSTFGDLQYFT